MKRRPRGHTGWCAEDHRCNLGEHRAEEIIVDLPGFGRAVLTRVATDNGRDHAEIRLRVALSDADPAARRQLFTILRDLRELVTHAALAAQPSPRRAG